MLRKNKRTMAQAWSAALLFDRGKWRGLYLPSDVVLETVTFGGTINSSCHGTGKTQVKPSMVNYSRKRWKCSRVTIFEKLAPGTEMGVVVGSKRCLARKWMFGARSAFL